MSEYLRCGILVFGLAVFAACSGKAGGDGAEDGGQDAGLDADVDAGLPCSVWLPQVVEGAMWANPDVYPNIPVRVAVSGQASSVDVTAGVTPVDAAPNGDGTWTSWISIDSEPDGFLPVSARAFCGDGTTADATAELGIGRTGVQLTDFGEAASALTPRIHRFGDHAYLTWTATYDASREAWIQRIDGAGRFKGDRIRLTGNAEPTLYARTVFGSQHVGVLYQQPGQPYTNHLSVCDLQGNPIHGPVDLDPAGWDGRPRGDLAFDGQGFVAVYRVMDASGYSEIHWLRMDEQSGQITGPTVVAATGDGSPVGGFEPFVFLKVAAMGQISVVSFVRDRYDVLLDIDLPKSQIAVIQQNGTLVSSDYVRPETDWTFDWECRVSRVGDGFVVYWAFYDLTDPDPNSPILFYGTRVDALGYLDPNRGAGNLMLESVSDREEPHLMGHPVHTGILAWTDYRSTVLDPPGWIQLYLAPIDENLAVHDEVMFPHAVIYATTSQVNTAPAGPNVLVVWTDERHGNGIMDPRPEIFFETAWY